MLLREYLSQFSPDIEALVLGCTHYPLLREHIEKVWTQDLSRLELIIIDPGEESARKFGEWKKKRKY
jgi:glutamate racemase